MKIVFGVLLSIGAVGLFAFNIYLGVFPGITGFSFKANEQKTDTTLERFVERVAKEHADISLEKMERNIAIPEPLKIFREPSSQLLEKEGILIATNIHRQTYGLLSLAENQTLNQIARAKIQDMFGLQYFEHESPTGILFTDLAEQYGYEYIAMGENLALGNYESEAMLVQAWMDSPGHRANILNAKYQEIGIAAEKGFFEGQETWLAVQTFGLGISACPAIEKGLGARIEAKKSEIEKLEGTLQTKKNELDSMHPKFGKVYEEKRKEYNKMVGVYNATAEEVQSLITSYNSQVRAFNTCAEA